MKSEVARIREQIQTEDQGAEQGLSGLASGTARHDSITREHTSGILHERLAELVGPDEADCHCRKYDLDHGIGKRFHEANTI